MLKSRATAPRNLINQWPESSKLKKRSVMLPRIRCPPSTIHGLANVSGLELGYDLGLVCLSTYLCSVYKKTKILRFLTPCQERSHLVLRVTSQRKLLFLSQNRKHETIPPPPTRRPHNPNLRRRQQQMHLQRRTPLPPSPPTPPLTPPPS